MNTKKDDQKCTYGVVDRVQKVHIHTHHADANFAQFGLVVVVNLVQHTLAQS